MNARSVFLFTSEMKPFVIQPRKRSHTLVYLTLQGSRFSTTTALSKFASTTSTRNSSSSLTNTCSPLSKRNMFEKPMAFLAIFEEESLFPKATDKTFAEKLMSNMLGKWSQFAKPNPRPDPDAHFAVIHYAATVSYNLTGWLEKNKDPLNDTIVEMIKNGSNSLMVRSFADHPGQPLEAPKDQDRKKKGGDKTVSSFFKSQLDDLMTTLYKTEPHFIRCVVPNTHKQPG